MGLNESSTNSRKGKYLNRHERIQIDVLLKTKHTRTEIARLLHRDVSTVRREIKRGLVEHRNSDWSTSLVYNADRAQEVHDLNMTARGPQLKLGAHYAAAQFICARIADDKFSPDVVSQLMKEEESLPCTFCTKTIYSYIDQGLIDRVSNESLWEKRKRCKRGRKPLRRRAKRMTAPGRSIEDRPEEVKERHIFGHWEIDLVLGGKEKGTAVLLTLTERKTRTIIARKLKDKTQASVLQAINRIERSMGAKAFRTRFKSITADNGSEFLNADGVEKSATTKQKRTTIYYAHPYSSWERGSNENANRMLRRFFKKGCDFTKVSQKKINEAVEWINNYPRKILNFKTAEELFIQEIAA